MGVNEMSIELENEECKRIYRDGRPSGADEVVFFAAQERRSRAHEGRCYWICLGENGVNWFQFWIMSGFPFGIQKMLVLLIPRNFGIAGSIGVLALDAVIGGMIGVIVLAIKIIAIIREVINIIMELAGKRISC